MYIYIYIIERVLSATLVKQNYVHDVAKSYNEFVA